MNAAINLSQKLSLRYNNPSEDFSSQADQNTATRPRYPISKAMVHDIAVLMALTELIVLPIRHVFNPWSAADFSVLALSATLAMLVTALLRKGLAPRLGAIAIACNSLVVVVYFASGNGGLSAPALIFTPTCIIFTSLVLGARAGMVATGFVVVSLVGLGVFIPVATDIPLAAGAEHPKLGPVRGTMYLCACLIVMFAITIYERRQRVLMEALESRALEDSLTGLGNRRALDTRLQAACSKTPTPHPEPTSLIIFDADHFKDLNDRAGHQAGDAALTTIASAVRRVATRKTDFVARYGGDEFVVILQATTAAAALEIAKRIQAEVLAERIEIPYTTAETERDPTLTLSIGVATTTNAPAPDLATELLSRADAALYEAKERGRNCIVTASELEDKKHR